MTTKLRLVLSITIAFVCFYGSAQSSYWHRMESKNVVIGTLQESNIKKKQLFSLNEDAFAQELNRSSALKKASIVVYFPDENGSLSRFLVKEASNMAPQLAAKYPKIKSYRGYGLKDKNKRIRFSVSPKGVESMITNAEGLHSTFMQKSGKQGQEYVVYTRDSKAAIGNNFICLTKTAMEKGSSGITMKPVGDQILRKYRIAISATGEYTQYHGGTVADALAAINATITRVNEVFETDLGITLELIAEEDSIIFTDSATDPYNGNLNNQVQNTLTTTLGEDKYDVGHLFHKDVDNGNAGFVGSVCVDNKKGSAYSSSTNPEGDTFDLEFVAHELGHQFGANHTWSYQSEGTLAQVEPGSGTTIMGYAGIAGENNVALHGDDYFHYYSIFQISQYTLGTSCPELIPITDNPPVLDSIGNFTIPKSTAFVLTGKATDPDVGDVLTYTWEQIDNGIVSNTIFGPTNPEGANFRSQKPSISPERYFPKLASVIKGNLTQIRPTVDSTWETVSNVERAMNFALTVRDNADGGGQVTSELVKVNVVNAAGPFVVTSQNSGEAYPGGSVQTISWEVANTDKSPVNAQTVDLFMSTDGGVSFPDSLATNVPNTGSYQIVMPGTATTEGRIMVKAHNNVFFAVNSANFTISPTEIVLDFNELSPDVCQPNDLDITFNYETYLGFAEESTFSATGLPAGMSASFSPATATVANTPITLTISGTGSVTVGNYPIFVKATAATLTQEVPLNLAVHDSNFSEVVLLSPQNGFVGARFGQLLEWQDDPEYSSYDLQIAKDSVFTDIVESVSVIFDSYLPLNLEPDTTYYWRVKPKNNCAEGSFGTPFSFTTTQLSCTNKSAGDLPEEIAKVGTSTITSKITFLDDLPIADVNVNLDIMHSFISDLTVSLTSPMGTTVVLISNSCGDSKNMVATFDDDADIFVCGNNPAISGIVKPLGSLASFVGESVQGDWILTVEDNAPSDGGSLNSFSLDVCIEGAFRPDADKDGVFDDGDDLCLGTPKGTEVDINGCPVYRFLPGNFSIVLQSESCRAGNDGSIQITAADPMDYTATLSGNGSDTSREFTDSVLLDNIRAGTYTLCITGLDGTNNYEPNCFEVVVTQPDPLSVAVKTTSNRQQLLLTMEGSDFYNIELNGALIQTEKGTITLNLKRGNNHVKVYTELPCQGSFDKVIFLSQDPIVYPNPVIGMARIFLVDHENEVKLTLYTSSGSFLRSEKRKVNGTETELNLVGLRAGVYYLVVEGKTVRKTIKVIKE
ncbi:M12 family metallo-peptidase [Flavobacteriaceae bacterium F89]|uniref:M12 family metallo-peptidase n=1 Tax=Cerina litoralis TaxID=2874477 RepID=A0AAE3JPB9_9FLAO|nr:zinc-dependent metalloprotease family protein [Cerina litoralis]MCG2460604.1 M12 family metallo-peptidase [Cerina litoralis]